MPAAVWRSVATESATPSESRRRKHFRSVRDWCRQEKPRHRDRLCRTPSGPAQARWTHGNRAPRRVPQQPVAQLAARRRVLSGLLRPAIRAIQFPTICRLFSTPGVPSTLGSRAASAIGRPSRCISTGRFRLATGPSPTRAPCSPPTRGHRLLKNRCAQRRHRHTAVRDRKSSRYFRIPDLYCGCRTS